MRISIALATYNGAAYLKEQLNSFLAQTLLPHELVVSDDASTDNTMSILEHFARTAPFEVTLLRNGRRVGHERNFERAMACCTGDLIFLSDQDDVWLSEKVATVAAEFYSQPNVSVVINDLHIANAVLEPTGHTVVEQIRSSGMWGESGKGFVVGCASAFRGALKELVIPIPPLNYGHDRWLHAIAHAIGGRYVLERPLQFFRRHGGNASTWLFDGAESPSWKEILNSSVGNDLRQSYANQRAVLRAVEERVMRQDPARYLGGRARDQALADLREAQQALSARVAALEAGPFARKLRAMGMFIRGDYRHFLGWRSFAKDMLR